MTSPRDLQFGFSGPGQIRGVFASMSYNYPATLYVQGQFTVARRILSDSGKTEDLGALATVPFNFTPADFGLDPATMQPDPNATPKTYVGRHPATDALTGRTWSLAAVMEALYSLQRGRWDEHLDERYPVAPPAPAPEPEPEQP